MDSFFRYQHSCMQFASAGDGRGGVLLFVLERPGTRYLAFLVHKVCWDLFLLPKYEIWGGGGGSRIEAQEPVGISIIITVIIICYFHTS